MIYHEAIFECEFDTYSNAKVSWIHDVKPLTTKDAIESWAQADKGFYTLRIAQGDISKYMEPTICRADMQLVQLNILFN